MVGKCPQEVVEDRWAAEEECEGQDSVWIMTWVTHPWVEATGLACAVAAADSAVAHPVSAEEVSVWDSETVNGEADSVWAVEWEEGQVQEAHSSSFPRLLVENRSQ